MAGPLVPAAEPLLVHCFAEFDLLPDLLVRRLRHPDETDAETVDAWARVLDKRDCNSDHVLDDEIPGGVPLETFMARDALVFCQRIGLLDEQGALSEPGLFIARMGETKYKKRSAADSREMTRILGEQIQRSFLGADDQPLTGLLQSASTVLAARPGGWPGELGGLLLSEVDTLLHWGVLDAARATRLARRGLLDIREVELRDIRQSAGGVTYDGPAPEGLSRALPDELVESMLDETRTEEEFAARIEDAHESDPRLSQESPLTITGLRATAMALVFAELFALGGLLGPQVLCPWEAPGDGR